MIIRKYLVSGDWSQSKYLRYVVSYLLCRFEPHFGKQSGPEVIKHFSCSTQLSVKFSLLINMKMPTIVGIFIFISREILVLSYV